MSSNDQAEGSKDDDNRKTKQAFVVWRDKASNKVFVAEKAQDGSFNTVDEFNFNSMDSARDLSTGEHQPKKQSKSSKRRKKRVSDEMKVFATKPREQIEAGAELDGEISATFAGNNFGRRTPNVEVWDGDLSKTENDLNDGVSGKRRRSVKRTNRRRSKKTKSNVHSMGDMAMKTDVTDAMKNFSFTESSISFDKEVTQPSLPTKNSTHDQSPCSDVPLPAKLASALNNCVAKCAVCLLVLLLILAYFYIFLLQLWYLSQATVSAYDASVDDCANANELCQRHGVSCFTHCGASRLQVFWYKLFG